jgi:alpha-glucosidase
LFSSGQPDWNWDNEDVREDFHQTLRFWADRGVDGFRVDVANLLAKDMSEPLRSKPTVSDDLTQVDGTDPIIDRDEVHEIYERWRDVFNEYDPPRTAVAEAWVPVKRRATYARPTELGQAFNFDLLLADWSDDQFRSVIQSNLTQVQQSGSSSTWVLSNHDVVRHASRYGLPAKQDFAHWLLSNGTDPVADRERGLRRARAATMLMFALPGSAYIYQGEELGLFEVADIPPSDLEDPIWRRSDHTRKGGMAAAFLCRGPSTLRRSGSEARNRICLSLTGSPSTACNSKTQQMDRRCRCTVRRWLHAASWYAMRASNGSTTKMASSTSFELAHGTA